MLYFFHIIKREEGEKEKERPFVINACKLFSPGRRGDLIDSFSAMHACISQTLPGKSLPA